MGKGNLVRPIRYRITGNNKNDEDNTSGEVFQKEPHEGIEPGGERR